MYHQKLLYLAMSNNKWLKASGYRPTPPKNMRKDLDPDFPKQGITKRKMGQK